MASFPYGYDASYASYARSGTTSGTWSYGSDVVTFGCGHQFSGNALHSGGASSAACPTCTQAQQAQQHTLHQAQMAKMQQAQSLSPQQYANAHELFRQSMMGASSPPKEPTMLEWLDAEVRSVCQLAFAA